MLNNSHSLELTFMWETCGKTWAIVLAFIAEAPSNYGNRTQSKITYS